MTWDSRRSWQQLRALRSQPPGLASSGDRRHTFTAALEQAEQLLHTAAQMGSETRPINLFYGLSQGARAVAAALDPNADTWRLRGHGIEQDTSLDRPIPSIRVKDTPEERGSFTRVARILGSPSLPTAVELGDLLAALPLNVPESTWSDRPRAVLVEHLPQSNGAWLTTSPLVFGRTQGWPILPGITEMPIEERQAQLAKYIDDYYPTLRGLDPMPEQHGQLAVFNGQMQFVLRLVADGQVGADFIREQMLYSRTVTVAGNEYAIPTFGGAARPCHPTVILWACLWAMSMLARYEPVRWAKLLDVDASGDAVGLEEVLDDALTMVPWALADALSLA